MLTLSFLPEGGKKCCVTGKWEVDMVSPYQVGNGRKTHRLSITTRPRFGTASRYYRKRCIRHVFQCHAVENEVLTEASWKLWSVPTSHLPRRAHTEGGQLAKVSESQKVRRSPDWSLQLDSMKSESLVIVDQNATVNTFPGLVHTARHTMGVGCKRSR